MHIQDWNNGNINNHANVERGNIHEISPVDKELSPNDCWEMESYLLPGMSPLTGDSIHSGEPCPYVHKQQKQTQQVVFLYV